MPAVSTNCQSVHKKLAAVSVPVPVPVHVSVSALDRCCVLMEECLTAVVVAVAVVVIPATAVTAECAVFAVFAVTAFAAVAAAAVVVIVPFEQASIAVFAIPVHCHHGCRSHCWCCR